MTSTWAKFCFSLTAISPGVGAAAVAAASVHGSWTWCVVLSIVAILCAAISILILSFVRKYVASEPLDVEEVEKADEHVLEFLLAYLLPVFSSVSIDKLEGALALTIYSLIVISVVIVQGNIFQFNPVLTFFGYHFYLVKSEKGIQHLVISQQHYYSAHRTIICKKLADYLMLEVTE